MNRIIRILIIAALIANCGMPAGADVTRYTKVFKAAITFWERSVPQDPILTEAAHIFFCQVPDFGAINNIVPNDGPTWVKPREMGTAILGLIEAYSYPGSLTEGNDLLFGAVQQAAMYLYFKQDEEDGGWCKHYNEQVGEISDMRKSPSEAGSVVMALYRIHQTGLEGEAPGSATWYDKAKMGAQFIIACIDNKPGDANGLAGAGKEYGVPGAYLYDNLGIYKWSDWSWVSDNCYAYQALKAMSAWADEQGDGDIETETGFAWLCQTKANGILNGINSTLKNPGNPVWYRVVGGNSLPVPTGDSTLIDALCYYPVKMNVVTGNNGIAQWMVDNLQKKDGGLTQGLGAFKWMDNAPGDSGALPHTRDRLSPGFSMEAWIALNNIPGEVSQEARDAAKMWWEAQEGTDGHGQLWDYQNPFRWTDRDKGGFVDWFDPDGFGGGDSYQFRADITEKFIDTSAYAIMVYAGGFSYDLASQAQTPLIAHGGAMGALASDTVFVTSGTISTNVGKDKNDASGSLLALGATGLPGAAAYTSKYKLDGLKQVNMYYYTDGAPAISTASVRVPGRAATYNFRFEVPVSLASHKYLYYCIEVIDSRGFHTFWPSTHRKQFFRVAVKSSAAKDIAADGGTVELDSGNALDGKTALIIPPGALDRKANITITEVPVDNTIHAGGTLTGGVKPVSVYRFEPEGLVFKKNVEMRLHYKDDNRDGIVDGTTYSENSLRIFWWDGVEWRLIGGTADPTTKLVTSKLKHFSLYAVFPTGTIADNDYRPKERIITPASYDGNYDFASFGGVENIEVIKIYDVNGKRIAQLRDALVWDGKDENGSVVESGLYIYQIKLRDNGKTISGTIAIAK